MARKQTATAGAVPLGSAVEAALERLVDGRPPPWAEDPQFAGRLQAIHQRKLEAKALLLDRLTRLKEAKRALQAIQEEEDRLLAAYLTSTLPLFEGVDGARRRVEP